MVDITRYTEADVREEILAPLLRSLGYSTGTEHDIQRELPLRYGYDQLGRRKPDDPVLRGKVDYVLTAGGRVRWVIEAKAPSVEISADGITQAFTYARHAEVNAVLYVVCNGHHFNVYQTINVQEAALVLTLSYDQYADPNNKSLVAHLAPESILQTFPAVHFNPGAPIGAGLRSIERVVSGFIRYSSEDPSFKVFSQHIISIVGGDVQRDGKQLVAHLEMRAPIVAIQNVLEQLNLRNIEMRCEDQELSADPNTPSIFFFSGAVVFPAGTTLFDVNTWSDVKLPMDLHVSVRWSAKGYLNGRRFVASVTNEMEFMGPSGSTQTSISGQAELLFG